MPDANLPRRPEALILDMDGVLFDSECLHAASWEQILTPLGLALEPDWFQPWIGVPDALMVEHFHKLLPDQPAASLLAAKREAYRLLSESELALFPGVFDEILAVKALRKPVAIATGSSEIDAVRLLKKLGVYDLLDALVYAELVVHKKPAPDPYLLAAERIGVPPASCAVVEDSPNGLASAVAAGCRAFTIASGIDPALLTASERMFPTTAEAIAHIRDLM